MTSGSIGINTNADDNPLIAQPMKNIQSLEGKLSNLEGPIKKRAQAISIKAMNINILLGAFWIILPIILPLII